MAIITLSNAWNLYGEWLLDSMNLGYEDGFIEEYHHLYEVLHTTPFTYTIPMDKNRMLDGIVQREYFLDDEDACPKSYRKLECFNVTECTLLEVLSAFAIRIDGEWIGDPNDPKPKIVFTEMLKNLGILIPDVVWMRRPSSTVNRVMDSIDVWLDRKFDFYGNGSIFPLKNNYEMIDQREIEMWMQMTAYLRENWR